MELTKENLKQAMDNAGHKYHHASAESGVGGNAIVNLMKRDEPPKTKPLRDALMSYIKKHI